MQNSELCFILLCESVCSLALALHRWHILRLAEVETNTHVDIRRLHILRNRYLLIEHRITSVDKVGSQEEVESRWVKVQCPTEYARLISVEECVAE